AGGSLFHREAAQGDVLADLGDGGGVQFAQRGAVDGQALGGFQVGGGAGGDGLRGLAREDVEVVGRSDEVGLAVDLENGGGVAGGAEDDLAFLGLATGTL